MPQAEAKFQINQFTGGLNTDANPLSDAGPVSVDEDNCEILSHGGRRRRRGAALEIGHLFHTVTPTNTQKQNWAFLTAEWKDVAGVSNLEFVVYQQGPKLWFYDKGTTPLSNGLKSFSVDLQSFRTAAATAEQVENTRVSIATGKGVIFVCGSAIEPFYVEYNQTSDTISTTQVTIQIRDFEEQSPEIGPKEEISVPGATTGQHLYDLLNQGWYQYGPWTRFSGTTFRGDVPVIELYRADPDTDTFLPRKNTPWHVGKYIVADGEDAETYFSAQQCRAAPSGNTLAPLGHYILDAFDKDRRQAVIDAGDDYTSTYFHADLNDLSPEVEDERPVAVSFYAGRVWWVLKNNVYFSQLLDDDDVSAAGKCYQDGDPTSEGESDVIATDGGLIPVSGMGRATAMAVTGTSLIVLADNGVWAISGTAGASFTAVDFSVNRLSTVSCRSPSSVVEAEGLVFFWGETGVYVAQPDQVREQASMSDLTENRITERYNAIPQSSKRNAYGFYDPVNKVIYWMYKATSDSAGPAVNRFAYDKFLNFSLKFSAWFPWSIDATSTHQIIGGTVASGVLTTLIEEDVTDSSLVDVTTSTGEDVTVYVESTAEISNQPKFLTLKNNNAKFASFTNLSFLDWNEDCNGVDYSSYIETFYHLQDDYMANMQAPYVYAYFRRTDETVTTIDIGGTNNNGIFPYTQIQEGGFVLDPSFINSQEKGFTGVQTPRLHSNSAYCVGLDGNRYAFQHGGIGAGSENTTLRIYNIDTGVESFNRESGVIQDDVEALGVTPPSGGYVATGGPIMPFMIPGTPYVIVIQSQSAGVDTSKLVAYYRINAASELECIGGYSGREGGLDVQFSPDAFGANAFQVIGFINSGQTVLPEENSLATTHNFVQFQYPIVVGYEGEGRASLLALPSINTIILSTALNENTTDHWLDKEFNIETTTFGNNIFNLRGTVAGSSMRSRGFLLPTETDGKFYKKWYQPDIDQHIAGTEPTTNTFLQTHDSTYPTGFISSLDLTLDGPDGGVMGVDVVASTVTTAVNSNWSGFPFSDETDNFDGTAGSSSNNYYCNPATFPLYPQDITLPWVLMFPKVFRGSGERDKIQVRAMLWDPVNEVAKDLGSMKGQFVDLSSDVGDSTLISQSASVYWDRTTGDVIVEVYMGGATVNSLVHAKLGTFSPQVNGLCDFFSSTDNTTVVESSCLLNTRWNWANATASGKISSDIQLYRGGVPRLVNDPDTPDPTGLPVYTSKTKTRGRGRALQLRFRSETGKDFELYGWAVWSGKNTRF